VAHLRAVPDPDDEPVVDAVAEPFDPAAPVAPGADDEGEADAVGDHAAYEDEPRRYPSTIGGAFYIVILLVAGAALVIASRGDWRLGVQVLGGALLGAAFLRLVLANRDAGMLAVRNRFLDALLLSNIVDIAEASAV
jgi:hypothetical protein